MATMSSLLKLPIRFSRRRLSAAMIWSVMALLDSLQSITRASPGYCRLVLLVSGTTTTHAQAETSITAEVAVSLVCDDGSVNSSSLCGHVANLSCLPANGSFLPNYSSSSTSLVSFLIPQRVCTGGMCFTSSCPKE